MLREWLLAVRCRPGRAVAAALVLAAGGYGLWIGIDAWQFRHARAGAERALAAYDFPEARRHLDECIRRRPDDPAIRLLAAQAARRAGDLAAAQDQLEAFRERNGSDAVAKLEGAMLQAQRGQVREVSNYLMSRLEIRHPATSELVLEALASGCVQIYHLDRASLWIHELLQRAPKNPIGMLLRGQSLETMGNYDKAEEAFRALIKDYPNHVKARLSLADLLVRTAQRFEEAAKHYEQARRLEPDQAAPLLGLVRCRIALAQTDEVRRLVAELEARYPDNSAALLECGRFAVTDNRLADAERLLRRAVQLAPFDREAHYRLGVCLQQLAQTGEAQQHIDKSRQIEADMIRIEKVFDAIVKAPDDPALRLEVGQICLRNGQAQEGLRWLHGALELNPGHMATHAALAAFYVQQGNAEQAEYHRQRAQ